jgi:hypothetical protein
MSVNDNETLYGDGPGDCGAHRTRIRATIQSGITGEPSAGDAERSSAERLRMAPA